MVTATCGKCLPSLFIPTIDPTPSIYGDISANILFLIATFSHKLKISKKRSNLLAPPGNSLAEFQRTAMNLLGFLSISFLLLLPFAGPQPHNILNAYDMLEKYNFPKGILPEGVQSYLLRTDGSFEVFLGEYCEFKVTGNYLLRYRRKISGKLQPGVLKNLSGVSVKIFLFSFGVSEVARSGDELRFYVGPFSASFPVSRFEMCPQCRNELSSLNQLVLPS